MSVLKLANNLPQVVSTWYNKPSSGHMEIDLKMVDIYGGEGVDTFGDQRLNVKINIHTSVGGWFIYYWSSTVCIELLKSFLDICVSSFLVLSLQVLYNFVSSNIDIKYDNFNHTKKSLDEFFNNLFLY